MSEALAPSSVHVRAPGKINVFFAVGGLGDDGYHEVASAYQAVSAYEDMWASPSDSFTIEVSGSVDVAGVPLGDRNLAIRAARLLADRCGVDAGVHLQVRKGVPVAGGMGGGSADAAAALVACDALWGTGLTSAQLQALGAELGADVPFALMGGTAIGLGRGEQLSPALARGRFDWVIVTSGDGLSTPEIYRELDEYRADHPESFLWAGASPQVFPPVLKALRTGDARLLAASASNELQIAAIRRRLELNDVLQLGHDEGALTGLVSGSGPTIAFLTEDESSAIDLQIALSAAGHTALHVHGPVPGARLLAS
ncbi:4-diphosphocytidyl-2C-methyl-D-erythritol kinase [Microbacterium mangrovi]|uniref:4-diphosphocytidyl-2-C-methyl-D-erythritol kinase n=1 Tax=Microbacterium mangrovi TaxID=1348253 RepID=A0A0B2A608_9MICO|nr:4-(cytidine 5'-diphospho)-2-C-methyl-D-erythritol kinase [Microbacterium mangrovi]KHK98515.1 4-diphosphocytidyl-2C-methyl-D-erythritol kinase [Microbacterium mangrovi]